MKSIHCQLIFNLQTAGESMERLLRVTWMHAETIFVDGRIMQCVGGRRIIIAVKPGRASADISRKETSFPIWERNLPIELLKVQPD